MTFHVIAYLNQLGQPTGITEGSAGVFYYASGTNPEAVSSIDTQGTKTVLATFPSGHQVDGPVVSGPDGRLYDTVEPTVSSANVFSVSAAPGMQVYAAQSLVPFLTQNLPDGSFLSLALGTGGGSWYVANVD